MKLLVQEVQNEQVHKTTVGQYIADEDDMGPYRNPPSVSSMISNSTHMSDYPNILSPGNEFEALDYESNVPMPQKVTGRRNTKRRTSGGKDLKRLGSGVKTPKSTMGKPYPPASARNGRLSRFQNTEYQENNCKLNPRQLSSPYLSNVCPFDFNAGLLMCSFVVQEGWWNMLKNVERWYLANLDFPCGKVRYRLN